MYIYFHTLNINDDVHAYLFFLYSQRSEEDLVMTLPEMVMSCFMLRMFCIKILGISTVYNLLVLLHKDT